MKNKQKNKARLLLACLLASNFMAQAYVASSPQAQPAKPFYKHYWDKAGENLSYYANALSEAVSNGAQATHKFLSDPRNQQALMALTQIIAHIADHVDKQNQAQAEADRKAALKAQKSLELYQAELRRQQEREKAQQDMYAHYPAGPMRTGHEQPQPAVNIDPFAYVPHDYEHQRDQNVYSYGPMRTGHEQYEQPNIDIDPFAHIPENQRQ